MTENTLNSLAAQAQKHAKEAQTLQTYAKHAGPHSRHGKFYRREAAAQTTLENYHQDLQTYHVHLENVQQKYNNLLDAESQGDIGQLDLNKLDLNKRVLIDAYQKCIDFASTLLQQYPAEAKSAIHQTLYQTLEALYTHEVSKNPPFIAWKIAHYMHEKGIPRGEDFAWQTQIAMMKHFLEYAKESEGGNGMTPLVWLENVFNLAASLIRDYRFDKETEQFYLVKNFSPSKRIEAKKILLRVWGLFKGKMQELGMKRRITFWQHDLEETLADV